MAVAGYGLTESIHYAIDALALTGHVTGSISQRQFNNIVQEFNDYKNGRWTKK